MPKIIPWMRKGFFLIYKHPPKTIYPLLYVNLNYFSHGVILDIGSKYAPYYGQEDDIMQQQINLGIIGVGEVTINRHIPSVLQTGDSAARVYALADIVPGIAQRVADKNGIPVATEDYHTLLEDENVHAIAICTPVHNHKQLTIEALNAGKHVYLEKPATMNAQEMEDIMQVSRNRSEILLVGSNGMLQPQMLLFKKMIDEGKLGELYLVSVERAASRKGDYVIASGRKAESGISMHSASHNIEWSLFFLGDPKPVSVVARGYYRYNNISKPGYRADEMDDCCIAIVQFDNGASFSFKALRGAPASAEYQLKLYGDMGTVEYDVQKCYKSKSNDCIRIQLDSGSLGMQEMRPLLDAGKTHADMYRHFFECIRTGTQSISNGERAVVVMRVLDAIAKSINEGGKQVML